ncbi:MAG: ABC transporter substrate-binding protein [Planctomycetes bacterium]|nr:ABC transporter substrate-binding protein [Planctomycetota bacterium]
MKKLWLLFAITLLFGFSYFAYQITHIKNRSKHSTNKPQKIVSLAPNLTEILFALELGDKIAAVSNSSDYPPEATEKNKVGTFWQPNTEAIIASKPDLVITLWFEQQKAVADSLNRLGYKTLTLKVETIEELWSAIEKIGDATGKQIEAEKLIATMKNSIFAYEQPVLRLSAPVLRSRATAKDESEGKQTIENKQRTRVLWVIQNEPLRVAAKNTFVNKLIELAGGENAIDTTFAQYPLINTEELISCGAEVIIQSAMSKNNIAKQQEAANVFWSKWQNLPAVKNNRIYVVEPDTVLRLGPRLSEGIELIANCLHPAASTKK